MHEFNLNIIEMIRLQTDLYHKSLDKRSNFEFEKAHIHLNVFPQDLVTFE